MQAEAKARCPSKNPQLILSVSGFVSVSACGGGG
jgi:hypothetical protein